MTKEEMFNKNTKIAYKIANRYLKNHSEEIEDIKQVALLGLWKAVLNYNKKYAFSTLAYKIIENEINYYLRKDKKKQLDISINTKVNENTTIENTLAEEKNYIEELEDKIELEEIRKITTEELNKLSNRDKRIYQYLEQGKKQQEISKIFKVSQPQVAKIQRKIIKRVCKRYEAV